MHVVDHVDQVDVLELHSPPRSPRQRGLVFDQHVHVADDVLRAHPRPCGCRPGWRRQRRSPWRGGRRRRGGSRSGSATCGSEGRPCSLRLGGSRRIGNHPRRAGRSGLELARLGWYPSGSREPAAGRGVTGERSPDRPSPPARSAGSVSSRRPASPSVGSSSRFSARADRATSSPGSAQPACTWRCSASS